MNNNKEEIKFRKNNRDMDGIILMMIKCIRDEIDNYLYYGNDEEKLEYKKDAEEYLFNDDYEKDNIFSFLNICHVLQYDHDLLRKKIKTAKNLKNDIKAFVEFKISQVKKNLFGELSIKRK